MPRFVDVIDLPLSPRAAFEDLAAFERVATWDPSVREAHRLDPVEPLGVGSRFAVVVAFLGRRVRFAYEITDCEAPVRLVLRGTSEGVVSIDTITFAPIRGGTRVTYEARLELAGVARLFAPVVDRLFQRSARRAADGLRAHGAALASARPRPLRRRRTARAARPAASRS